MIIPNIWENKKCSKPPTSFMWIHVAWKKGRRFFHPTGSRMIFPRIWWPLLAFSSHSHPKSHDKNHYITLYHYILLYHPLNLHWIPLPHHLSWRNPPNMVPAASWTSAPRPNGWTKTRPPPGTSDDRGPTNGNSGHHHPIETCQERIKMLGLST